MLRTFLGLFTVVATIISLAACGASLLSRRVDSLTHHPAVTTAILEGDIQVATECELPSDETVSSEQLVSVAVCDRTAVGRLVSGRRDLDSTHLESLLTCGRLLI